MQNIPPGDIYQKVDWCIYEILRMKEREQNLKPKSTKTKHWYSDWTTWFCLMLGLVVLWMVYVMYMHDMGYSILLPEWMK